MGVQLLTVLEVGLILMRRYFTSETSGFAYLRATEDGWMMEKRLISLVSTPLLVVVVSYSAPSTERFRQVIVHRRNDGPVGKTARCPTGKGLL